MKLPEIKNIRLFNSYGFVKEYKEWISEKSNRRGHRLDAPNNTLVVNELQEGMIVRFPRSITETCFDLNLYVAHSPQGEPNLRWLIPISPVSAPADSYEVRLIVFPHDETSRDETFIADLLSRATGSVFQCCCVLQCWNAFCLPKDKIVGVAEIRCVVPDSEIQVARYGLDMANSEGETQIPGDYHDRTGWHTPLDMELMQEYANAWHKHFSLFWDL